MALYANLYCGSQLITFGTDCALKLKFLPTIESVMVLNLNRSCTILNRRVIENMFELDISYIPGGEIDGR
jgi:hypothetical protein